MDYETEIIDGRKAIVRHFFKAHEIQIGSRWARADGSKGFVTVEGAEDMVLDARDVLDVCDELEAL